MPTWTGFRFSCGTSFMAKGRFPIQRWLDSAKIIEIRGDPANSWEADRLT